uniref:MPN635 N-terminal domain-containing protein n=1 Tax=viral metagenome TaxID=1070528 RepID=A0A6C0E392_9ZZZZ
MSYPKYYDINVGDNVLTHLEIEDALKEIISNAIDEHNSIEPKPKKDIEIGQKDNGKWFIRDYGRGIKTKHFELNTNPEKINNPIMKGCFGYGLKDSIAILYSKNITFKIYTKSYIYIPVMHAKSDFPDQETLHLQVLKNKTEGLMNNDKGTLFVFDNLTLELINKAKSKFVQFKNPTILFENDECKMFKLDTYQSVFINGVEVRANTNLHFSYDVKSTDKIRKLFNRDRKDMDIKPVKKYIHDICLKKIIITKNEGQFFDLIRDILGLDEKLLQEFNQIDILRSIIYQINSFDKYVFIGTKEKYTDIKDKIIADNKEILFLGNGCKRKFGVKTIRELWHTDKFTSKINTDDNKNILTIYKYLDADNFDFIKIIAPIEKIFKKLPDNIKENIRNIVIDNDYNDDSESESESDDYDEKNNEIEPTLKATNKDKIKTYGYDFDTLPLTVSRKLTHEKYEEKLFVALTKYIFNTLPDKYFEELKLKEPQIEPTEPPKPKRKWLFGF